MSAEETESDPEMMGDTTQNNELSKDVIFELLSSERRRKAVTYLRVNGDHTTLSTLATQLATQEYEVDVETLSSQQRKRVYIALYQSHLPKLDDAGVVKFDSHRGTIELSSNASALYPYLDLDPTPDQIDSTESSGVYDRVAGSMKRIHKHLI